jgi:catechol 2,3-dioxygenase-like lactoylglutathione lyase family enzyme
MPEPTASAPVGPRAILETCLYVNDLDAAQAFYREVLGLRELSRQEGRHVFFRCGDAMLLLFNPAATAQLLEEIPPHGAQGPGHVAFGVRQSELDAWRSRLSGQGVRIESEVLWPSGVRSLYFRDPAGNSLELTSPRLWGMEELRGPH